nr:hypothetical protein [Tanacetum cinerariifolium]
NIVGRRPDGSVGECFDDPFKVESESTEDFCYKRGAELTGAKSYDCRISVAESFTTCFCKTWNVSSSNC